MACPPRPGSSSGSPSATVGALALSTHRVERVVDTDTGILAGLGSVRPIGVDTPGQESSAFLPRLLAGQSVRVEHAQTTDGFRRTFAYLTLPDGSGESRESST